MSRGNLEEEREPGPNALLQNRFGTIPMRCDSCGLVWESAHFNEGCPLSELEAAFLSENRFMVPSEATS
jgi:hypothetical protein